MIILHASEHGGAIELWGELSSDDPGRESASGKKARGRRHPYSVPASEILDRLKSYLRIGRGQHYPSTKIWLPSRGGRPLSSDGTALGPTKFDPRADLGNWTVQSVIFPPKETARVLLEVVRNRSVIAGMAVGPDLAYWSDVARFAGFIVARQQFLPDLSHYYRAMAGWTPVFLGEDHERLIALAKRMPMAACALEKPYGGAFSADSPVLLLVRVLNPLVTYMVCSAALAAAPKEYVKQDRLPGVHAAWLYDLRTGRNRTRLHYQHIELAEDVVAWRAKIKQLVHPSLTVCFRLEEPDDSSAKGSDRRWFVRYFIKSRKDPSLIIPAEKIWSGEGIPALGGDGRHAREFLLATLGRLSKVVTGMSAGLEEHGVGGYALDTDAAHRFLNVEAPMLEQLGFVMMLPAWWVGGGTRTRLTARAVAAPRMQAGGMFDINSLMEFDWQLALGDRSITLEDLQRLADAKSPLVNMRGQWMETGSGRIRQAIDFLKKRGRMSVRDSVMMEFGFAEAPEWMDFKASSRDDRIAEVMGTLRGDAKIRDLPQPDGFVGTLRPYQLRGYSWLAFLEGIGLGGCLADDMGLGKTVQMLALAQQYKRAGKKGPILLVCPTSVMDNWRREAARFAPELSVAIHHGSGRSRGEEFARYAAGHDIVVSSYGLVYRDIGFIGPVRWSGVVLDEAQNIKNPGTGQARAARSLDAGFRFALTGTPVENSVGDMWSIMEFLNPGLLGTQAEFKRNFFTPIQADRDAQAAETLRRITGPFMLRRLKTDRSVIADLPKKMEMNVYCSLTKEQASLYAAVLKNVEEELKAADGIRRKGLILAALTKLKQVCNHPAHLLKDGSAIAGRSGKLARLTEMLEEVISSGERALVFTQFVEMGELLRRHVTETFGGDVPFLHGGVPKKQRDAMVAKFQDGGSAVFIVSLKAGGTGLNLTAASHVFHFDRWWNPAVENQATDRAFRIGQERNVQVHKMICAGTLEERIDEIINSKKEISEGVVGTGEGWLTNLSDAEIRDVLALSREATRL